MRFNSSTSLLYRRIAFSLIFLFWLRYFLTGTLLHQLEAPQLVFAHTDNLYALLLFTGIPEWLVRSYTAALCFDLSLTLVIAANIWLHRGWLTACYLLLITLYIATFHCYMNHHTHALTLLFFAALPLLFTRHRRIKLCLEGLRYYILFIMSSAALWKLVRGALWYTDQMAEILKHQHAAHFIFGASPWREGLWQYLITHPMPAQGLYAGALLLQLTFIIGFFTKRADTWLALGLCVFIIANRLLMDIDFAELTLMALVLLPLHRVSRGT